MSPPIHPTLILDANPASGHLLAAQLRHAGLASDVASTYTEAMSAVHGKHYGTMIFIGDPRDAETLSCLADLRTGAPHTWVIFVALATPGSTRELTWRHGVDALLTMPYSVKDLASRLSAFALRSRPP